MAPLAVDREKLLSMIARLEERLKELEKFRQRPGEHRYAVERLLHLSVEECINIGSSIVSELGFRKADTYKEVFEVLKGEGLIGEKSCSDLKEFVALRNKLVHVYWEVQEKEIAEALEKLHVFRIFVEEILRNLKEKGWMD